jgi:PPOX class probable F420-dependent enzyme
VDSTTTKRRRAKHASRLEEAISGPAERRLRDEREIWITTVRSDGQPQSSLVGFLWDGREILVLSQPDAGKIRNLRGNPKVALHLEVARGDGAGAGVLTLEGVAVLDPNPLGAAEASAYVQKYEDVLRSEQLTADELFAEYSAVLRVRPTRARAH